MTETKPTHTSCCAPERTETARKARTFLPRADVYETSENVVIQADMPGVDEKSVDITLENDLLTLRGNVTPSEAGGFTHGYAEYDEGNYERAFKLGDAVNREGIQASVKNGVLRVVLPKAGPASARKIEVKTN